MKKRRVIKHSNENIDNQEIISGPEEKLEYYCPYCNFLLTVKLSKDEYWCNRCQVSLFLEQDQPKRKSRLVAPERNQETLITSVPSAYEEDVRIKKEPEPKGSFKLLKDKGLKITNYQEYDP